MPFHVRVTHKNPQRRSKDTVVVDKDEQWLTEPDRATVVARTAVGARWSNTVPQLDAT